MDLLERMARGPKYVFPTMSEIVLDVFIQLTVDDRMALVRLSYTNGLQDLVGGWRDMLVHQYTLNDFNNPYFYGKETDKVVLEIIEFVVIYCEESLNI